MIFTLLIMFICTVGVRSFTRMSTSGGSNTGAWSDNSKGSVLSKEFSEEEHFSEESDTESVDLNSDATLLMVHSEILDFADLKPKKAKTTKTNTKAKASKSKKLPCKQTISRSTENLAKHATKMPVNSQHDAKQLKSTEIKKTTTETAKKQNEKTDLTNKEQNQKLRKVQSNPNFQPSAVAETPVVPATNIVAETRRTETELPRDPPKASSKKSHKVKKAKRTTKKTKHKPDRKVSGEKGEPPAAEAIADKPSTDKSSATPKKSEKVKEKKVRKSKTEKKQKAQKSKQSSKKEGGKKKKKRKHKSKKPSGATKKNKRTKKSKKKPLAVQKETNDAKEK